MPTYCYKTEDGEIYDCDFPMGEAPQEVELLAGNVRVIAIRDYQAEGVGEFVKGSDNPVNPRRKTWPMEPCVASGVHPSQAPELREHFKKHGVSVDVLPSGEPVYESSGQRKKALECRGMYDKASFN